MMKPSKWIDIYDQIDKKITVVIIEEEDKKFNDILVQEIQKRSKLLDLTNKADFIKCLM